MALPDELVAARDVVFAIADSVELTLDVLRLPDTKDSNLPVLMYIHGGAFCWGDKCNDEHLLEPFLKAGYVVFNINHRLAPDFVFPAQVHDCKAAVRWVRTNADHYGGNPERIGVLGFSSGGNLAAMLGTTADVPELEGKHGVQGVSSGVQAVAAISSVTNFVRIEGFLPDDLQMGVWYFGVAGIAGFPVALKASPVNYITPTCPPFMIMCNTNDEIVPSGQAENMHNVLVECGVKSELTTFTMESHEAYVLVSAIKEDTLIPLLAFFNHHVRC